MKLQVVQDFGSADTASVVDAYRSHDLYASMRDLPFVGTPNVQNVTVDGAVVSTAVQWRVNLDLPAVALAFVDPGKLVFVEHATLEESGAGEFRIVPDHYPKLLRASGTTAITGGDGRTIRTTAGTLKVDLGWKGKLFEAQVEQAIADGLTKSLQAQVPQVQRFIDS